MWDSPLRKLFGKVITFDPQEQVYNYGKDIMNKKFLDVIKKEKPDFIFLWLIYDEFYIDTLIKIKEVSPNSKIINFCGDDDTVFENYTVYLFPFIDYFYSTQTPYFKDYKNPVFFAAGADTNEFKPLNLQKIYDVSFIGSIKGKRKSQLKYLINNNINVALFGNSYDDDSILKKAYLGKPPEDRFSLKLMNQTRVNLCLSTNHENKPHLIERFFQISACKAFCLVDEYDGYFGLLNRGKEIATFNSNEDLLKKVRYYLKHEKERQKIADAAYKKTLKYFSNEYLLEKAFSEIIRDKSEIFGPKLPKENKVIYLNHQDLTTNKVALKKRLSNFDYICFDNNSQPLKHKEEIQIYAMNYWNKPISCCDFYANSLLLGDWFIILMRNTFRMLPRDYFLKTLDISQLMVKKDYFLKDIDKFVSLYTRTPVDFINEENTAFVSFPLVRIFGKKILFNKSYNENMSPLFENKLRNLKSNRRLFSSTSFYKLLLFFVITPFLWKYYFKKTNKLLNSIDIFSRLFNNYNR